MPRGRQENPNKKARQSRIYRLNQKHQKRFEAPLREFIETKYKLILEEYVDLYKRMDSQYPYRIDLRKTEMFKEWKQLNSQTNPDILTLAVRETIENENGTEQNGSEQDESELEAVDQSESEQGEDETADQSESEQNGSEQDEAELEAVHQRDPGEGLIAAQQLDDLVNEMMRDEQLGPLLNLETQDDEGIELNLKDEIDYDPFDFRLEVELAAW